MPHVIPHLGRAVMLAGLTVGCLATPPPSPPATPLSSRTSAAPAGWTIYNGDDPPYAIALPPAWTLRQGLADAVFEAESADQGSILFIRIDAAAGTEDLSLYVQKSIKVDEVTGMAPTVEDVVLPGGRAMKRTAPGFERSNAVTYFFPSRGFGVVILGFSPNLESGDHMPALWDEIARTFNPYGAEIPLTPSTGG